MTLILFAVLDLACVILGSCAGVDSRDRIRDRDPVAILTVVITCLCALGAYVCTMYVLGALGSSA